MKVDKKGAAVLRDDRLSEETFKIQKRKCDPCYYKGSMWGGAREGKTSSRFGHRASITAEP